MIRKLLLGKSKKKAQSALPTLEKLHGTLEMLDKKDRVLQKKVSVETQKAKDLVKSKNKNAAIRCLKKKRLYESQIEQLNKFQLRVHDQIMLLETANATTDTIGALKTGSLAINTIQRSLNIDNIGGAMEEITGYTEHMREVQEALAAPVGLASDFDEDELEAELEELAEIERLGKAQELPDSPKNTISSWTPSKAKPARKVSLPPNSHVEKLAQMAL